MPSANQLSVVVKADKEKAKIGMEDNLIVELVGERAQQKDGKPTGQTDRFSVGVLPAVPFRIVDPATVEPAKPAEDKPAAKPVRQKLGLNQAKKKSQ